MEGAFKVILRSIPAKTGEEGDLFIEEFSKGFNISIDVAKKIVAYMRDEQRVFVSGVMYPVVPKTVILLRLIPTAAHTDEQIEKTLEGFKNLRDEFKLQLDTVKI